MEQKGKRMLRSMVVLGFAGLMSLTCLAQSDASASNKNSPAAETASNASKQFFHLQFAVQEVEDGHVINSRSYSMVMSEMETSSIRAGEKVPFSFSSTSGTSTQWQQIDVGVNIDCHRLETTTDGVALDIKAEISSVMENGSNSP